jgi:signal transduction histidine kinase
MTGVTIRRVALGVTIAALLVLGVLDLRQHYAMHAGVAVILTFARVVPLTIYRRVPTVAWSTELAAVLVTALITKPVSSAEPWPWAVTSIAALAALAAVVAAHGHRRLSTVMVGVLIALTVVLGFVPRDSNWAAGWLAIAACGLAVFVGDYVHGRQQIVEELAEERHTSAVERELRSVVEERARIARELHDVVAHHMSMITVQAETARYRHKDLPPEAVRELTEIAQVARSSLSELRGLLSALRDEGADPNRTPQPTLADLPALADRITASGTPVKLTVSTDTAPLPQVVQLAVYRIVQEGLSNVVRHAPGAPTRVSITREANTLHIEVTNTRPRSVRPARNPKGHGLIGLRERATLLGGTFQVDQPSGGWRLRASLPV